MDGGRNYEQAAESYYLALLRARPEARNVAREMENTADYLGEEGHLDLARALRIVIVRHLTHAADPYRGSQGV